MYTPSMIAAASVAAALHGLGWTSKSGCSLTQLLQHLQQITAIEQVRYLNITVSFQPAQPPPTRISHSDYVTGLFLSDRQKKKSGKSHASHKKNSLFNEQSNRCRAHVWIKKRTVTLKKCVQKKYKNCRLK